MPIVGWVSTGVLALPLTWLAVGLSLQGPDMFAGDIADREIELGGASRSGVAIDRQRLCDVSGWRNVSRIVHAPRCPPLQELAVPSSSSAIRCKSSIRVRMSCKC